MPSKFPSIVRWLLWSLATWLALAGACFGLMGDLSGPMNWMRGSIFGAPFPYLGDAARRWLLIYLLPLGAVICGWRALRSTGQMGRWARIAFWVPAIAGIAVIAVFFQGQCECFFAKDLETGFEMRLLAGAAGVSVIALLMVALTDARAGRLKVVGFAAFGDIACAAACLAAALTVSYFVWLKACVEPLQRAAAQRWTDIGRPMSEFANGLKPTLENDSLRELGRDLKPFGFVSFYRPIVVKEKLPKAWYVDIPRDMSGELGQIAGQGAGLPGVHFSANVNAELDVHARDFDALYAGILRRDPPEWDLDPSADFERIQEADNHTASTLAWWALADGYYRLAKGDPKAAADAVTAVSRVTRAIGGQPFRDSWMAESEIESSFTPLLARLPPDFPVLEQLEDYVRERRKRFQASMQYEIWFAMHGAETHPGPWEFDALMERYPELRFLPDWAKRRFQFCAHSWVLMQLGISSLGTAEISRLCDRAAELAKSDLGSDEMDRAISLYNPFPGDDWVVFNCDLLLREQAEMIRVARARLKSGRNGDLGEQPSVVIPGSTWIMTGDADAHSISLKLSPVPVWTSRESNWLLPLGGGRFWQFQPSEPQRKGDSP